MMQAEALFHEGDFSDAQTHYQQLVQWLPKAMSHPVFTPNQAELAANLDLCRQRLEAIGKLGVCLDNVKSECSKPHASIAYVSFADTD